VDMICCFAVQKMDLSAEVKKKYPHYNLYLYGEGFVSFDLVFHVNTIYLQCRDYTVNISSV